MAEFYCDQTLQFSSICFAAEWITKSAFKALHGAQRSGECGLSTLVADKVLLQKGLSCKIYIYIYQEEAEYWVKRASLSVMST